MSRRAAQTFPAPVVAAMRGGASSATCVVVELDGGAPEAAFFCHVGGADARADRRLLKRWQGALPIELETELIDTAAGGVVMLRVEVALGPSEPLAFEILLTPGAGGGHFECLQLLSRQAGLTWFFGDTQFQVIRAQRHTLDAERHAVFAELLRDATTHDAVVRLTGSYDAARALNEVAGRYALREDTPP